MDIQIMGEGRDIAFVSGGEGLIFDAQSALDLLMTVQYQTGCGKIILNKASICEEFFILSSGIAGEILQKFVTYRTRLAIVGDFSGYTSKPLRDFIYESNKGKHIAFAGTVGEAVEKLESV